MFMRPGAYLAKRRAAAGMTIEDVALRVETDPPLNLRDRVDWLKRIEQDVAAVDTGVASALKPVYHFDARILMTLVRAQDGNLPDTIAAPRLCAICACSERDPCDDRGTGRGCYWAGPEICSSCIAAEKTEQAA